MTTTDIKALANAAIMDRLRNFGHDEADFVQGKDGPLIRRFIAATPAELAFEAVCRPMPAPLPPRPANPAIDALVAAFKAAKRT